MEKEKQVAEQETSTGVIVALLFGIGLFILGFIFTFLYIKIYMFSEYYELGMEVQEFNIYKSVFAILGFGGTIVGYITTALAIFSKR